MALTFDEVHFEPAENDAVIWATDGNGRFCLTIRRRYLMDHYGLERVFDDKAAKELIGKHWDGFRRIAQAKRDSGASAFALGD